ncbi:Glycerol-3-phosphate responsive antiterminator, partial [gut metagenome]
LCRPLIASGLISDKEDVIAALSAGALAVSSTCPAVWKL